jgi:hypothetical protein
MATEAAYLMAVRGTGRPHPPALGRPVRFRQRQAKATRPAGEQAAGRPNPTTRMRQLAASSALLAAPKPAVLTIVAIGGQAAAHIGATRARRARGWVEVATRWSRAESGIEVREWVCGVASAVVLVR